MIAPSLYHEYPRQAALIFKYLMCCVLRVDPIQKRQAGNSDLPRYIINMNSNV